MAPGSAATTTGEFDEAVSAQGRWCSFVMSAQEWAWARISDPDRSSRRRQSIFLISIRRSCVIAMNSTITLISMIQ